MSTLAPTVRRSQTRSNMCCDCTGRRVQLGCIRCESRFVNCRGSVLPVALLLTVLLCSLFRPGWWNDCAWAFSSREVLSHALTVWCVLSTCQTRKRLSVDTSWRMLAQHASCFERAPVTLASGMPCNNLLVSARLDNSLCMCVQQNVRFSQPTRV